MIVRREGANSFSITATAIKLQVYDMIVKRCHFYSNTLHRDLNGSQSKLNDDLINRSVILYN